jgi:hypothetical protein
MLQMRTDLFSALPGRCHCQFRHAVIRKYLLIAWLSQAVTMDSNWKTNCQAQHETRLTSALLLNFTFRIVTIKYGPLVRLKMHFHTAYSYFMYVCMYLFTVPSTMQITSFYHHSAYTYFLDHKNGTNSKWTNMNFLFLMFNLSYFYVICDIFKGAVCSSTLYYVEWQGNKQNVMDVAGSNPVLILGTTLAFAWKNWGKPRKSSVRIVGVQTDSWTRNIHNIRLSHSAISITVNMRT